MSAERLSHQPAEWACRNPAGIALRHWDDGTVVFDESDTQLQLLNPVAGELMRMLMQETSATPFQLAERLLGEMPTEEDVIMVENVLEEFSSLNLIHRLAI